MAGVENIDPLEAHGIQHNYNSSGPRPSVLKCFFPFQINLNFQDDAFVICWVNATDNEMFASWN